MKQPNLSDLRMDHAGTRRIRAAAKKGSVRIRINIDRDSLALLRAMAVKFPIPSREKVGGRGVGAYAYHFCNTQ